VLEQASALFDGQRNWVCMSGSRCISNEIEEIC
jgi:hypothetical protein